MEPIHKFNNGNGATLCNDCGCMISTGHIEQLYCRNCKDLRNSVDLSIRTTLCVINKLSIRHTIDKIIKEIHRNYDRRRE